LGRSRLFETIISELSSPKSELILVTGSAGSGRTHLLRHLVAEAPQLGYHVAMANDGELVTIEPSTSIADVRLFAEKVANDIAQDSSIVPEHQPTPSGLAEAKHIAAILRELTPLLVVIDGFRPASAFQAWFTDLLIPRLRGRGGRVSAVVADRAEALEPLARFSDLTVALGPLDPDEARMYLRNAAEGLSPELTTDELERYVAATVTEPGLFRALLAVFEASGHRHSGVSS
jgi:hypothetical protein